MNLMRETTALWHARHFGQSFEVLRATYFTHSFARHTHDGFAIGVIERGGETFYYRGEIHAAPPGSIVVINPGEIHTGQAIDPLGGWVYRMIYPEVDLLRQAASALAARAVDMPFFPRPVIEDPPLFRLLREMHITLEREPDALTRETRLLGVLAQLVARHAEQRPDLPTLPGERRAVERAREYLDAHFAENISLEALAAVANLSPFHLSRLFRRQTGLPPHAYLTHVRIRRAKQLLLAGVAIADVAARTGFSDQSHLTRHFKRIVGVTPGQYHL